MTVELDAAGEVAQLVSDISALAEIERPSASEGEQEAANWVAGRFRALGLETKIEVERAQGGYWLPLGVGLGLGVAGGLLGMRGKRLLGFCAAALGSAGIWDDLTCGPRLLRAVLRKRETFNVKATLGSSTAPRTVVVVAHHDAAHPGLVFHPAIPELTKRLAPGLVERTETSPPLMWPLIAGPVLAAIGAGLKSRRVAAAGVVASAAGQLAMLDIGARKAVPGANDNASGVAAMLAMAHRLAAAPPDNLRVLFVSTGSEEAMAEGAIAFGRRHFASLPTDSTFFLGIDSVGSPHLLCLEGEGYFQMHDYPAPAKALLYDVADELGIEVWRNLRLRAGGDMFIPLKAGYPTVQLLACDDFKQPINYHWHTDLPDDVHYETVADAVTLSEGIVRRLNDDWLV